jgi:TonB-dependent receptor
MGTVVGRVLDATAGKPIAGVTVTLIAPGGDQTRLTDGDGTFSFGPVAAGSYEVQFRKPGFRDAALEGLGVAPGREVRADTSLAPAPAATAPAGPVDIEEFVVIGSPEQEILSASRMTSDQLLNTLNAEEISKFAASDVAAALKFVAGVNVVEGQFAVIRGLEDRYSSTLFNGAVVPSPDPNSQSVQLDLFPADIVTNLVVSKTFAPESPSNSSGGSIDVITTQVPEQWEIKFSSQTGFNDEAWDQFLRYNRNSATGIEEDGWDVLESEFGLSISGPAEVLGRDLRFRGLLNRELDFDTAEGWREGREPKTVRRSANGTALSTGDLSIGDLSLSSGFFDLVESERSEQLTGYAGFGFDLDEEGDHKIDFTTFYTRKDEEVVERRDSGYFPDYDYSELVQNQIEGEPFDRQLFQDVATIGSWIAKGREEIDAPDRGQLWYSSFAESRSFEIDRDLRIFQLNGDHTIAQIDGLKIRWVINDAETSQDETVRGLRYYYEPDDPTIVPTRFPVVPSALGDGTYAATGGFRYSGNKIEEQGRFGRVDAEYEIPVELPWIEEVTFKLNGGGWYEEADRDVVSEFLDGNPRVPGSGQIVVRGDTPEELGTSAFEDLILDDKGRPQFTRDTTSKASRKIKAWDVGARATFFERLDLFGGIRDERIRIESDNDPFTGARTFTGAPGIFPSAYLFFDRLDNPRIGEGNPPPGIVYNDQILGIRVPIDPVTGLVDFRTRESLEAVINGRIDETKMLPSLGFTFRPIEGLSLRGAYSMTVARPSFREIGYYATVEPGTDDVTVGNPQLQLSDVESYDLRAEYNWGTLGDLAAVSVFWKEIEDPIERIAVRDASNAEFDDSGLFRTYFNNPNEAKLRGIEAEARKNLGFIGPDFLEYFSIGGNFTYIDAEVERTAAELARASQLFGVLPEDRSEERFRKYERKRRLYNQPEWIANADVTFDNPDWGTKLTLSFYAISSVLDAAGVASVDRLNVPRTFTLDRYIDSYYQLDFIASQRIWRGLEAKFSVKNLSNSTRDIIYDEDQTRYTITERSLKIGRDFSFSLTYKLEF